MEESMTKAVFDKWLAEFSERYPKGKTIETEVVIAEIGRLVLMVGETLEARIRALEQSSHEGV